MSLFEMRDMRELCRNCQLELVEPDVNIALPDVFGHCEVKGSKRQHDSGYF